MGIKLQERGRLVKNNIIPFRIRKALDDDLKAEFEKLPPEVDRSEIIREALRFYFKWKTKQEAKSNSKIKRQQGNHKS